MSRFGTLKHQTPGKELLVVVLLELEELNLLLPVKVRTQCTASHHHEVAGIPKVHAGFGVLNKVRVARQGLIRCPLVQHQLNICSPTLEIRVEVPGKYGEAKLVGLVCSHSVVTVFVHDKPKHGPRREKSVYKLVPV